MPHLLLATPMYAFIGGDGLRRHCAKELDGYGVMVLWYGVMVLEMGTSYFLLFSRKYPLTNVPSVYKITII